MLHWLDMTTNYWVVEEYFPDGFSCESHFAAHAAAIRYAAMLHREYMVHTRIYLAG